MNCRHYACVRLYERLTGNVHNGEVECLDAPHSANLNPLARWEKLRFSNESFGVENELFHTAPAPDPDQL